MRRRRVRRENGCRDKVKHRISGWSGDGNKDSRVGGCGSLLLLCHYQAQTMRFERSVRLRGPKVVPKPLSLFIESCNACKVWILHF